MLILKALRLGEMHGLGISHRIEQISQGMFVVESPDRYFPCTTPDAGGRLDQFGLGRVRNQPPGKVLPPDEGWRETVGGGNREVGADRA